MVRNRITGNGTLIAVAMMIAAAQSAQAVVLIEDTFDTNNGGTGWFAGSSWTAGVSGGELNYTGGAQERLFAAPITASDYWMAITWERDPTDTGSYATTGAWQGSGGQPYFLGFHDGFDPGLPDQTRFPVEFQSNAAPVGGYHTVLFHIQNVNPGVSFDYESWAFSGDETSVNPATLGSPNWQTLSTRNTASTTPDRWIMQGGISIDYDRIAIADNQFEVLGQAVPEISSVGLNFAGADNNPGGRKAIDAGTTAGAPGYAQVNWNNTPGTGQVGTPSSANDTMLNLKDASGVTTTLDVTFTSSQTWGTDFGGSPTGDQQLKGNSINSGASVSVSEIPFAAYDVVVYFTNFQNGNFNEDITLTLEDASQMFRFVTTVWEDASGSGDIGWVEVSDLATTAGARETGNYTVFHNVTGSSFVLSALGSSPGFDAIQIVALAAPSAVPSPAALPAGLIGLLLVTFRRRRHAAP